MKKRNALLGAAIAGIIGSATASSAFAKDMKDKMDSMQPKADMEQCYGINACKGNGMCGGGGHGCAGMNGCKGKGWLEVPKGLCEKINGGSLTEKKK